MPVVELEKVARTFVDGPRRRQVLAGVDLSVEPGEIVALVGPSGCGKTTLLTIVGALDVHFEGLARFDGRSLQDLDDDARTRLRNQNIGFVFQAFHLLDHLSVLQNVAVPLWLQPHRRTAADEQTLAQSALAKVGLQDRLEERVSRLSGGERQRVAIARAMVNRPKLLLADEPTGNLDEATGSTIYDLFDHFRKEAEGEACAVIVATHDKALARGADRAFTLVDGKLEALS